MTCPSEERLCGYVDGELPIFEVRELESHLVACRACRANVLALRDEVSVLSDVLFDRELGPARAVAPREQARGLMIGLGPALGVAALVVTTLGWLLEARLPAGTGWLSPTRWMGAYEMFFDTLFLLRDEAPELVDTAIAQGAIFAVAAILTFLVGSLSRRITGTVACLLLAAGASLLAAPGASAFDLRMHQEKVVIAAGETHPQTLIASGESVRIEGRVEGDLVAMADRIHISGEVAGNVVLLGDEVDVEGVVEGSLLAAGDRVQIDGEVRGHVYAVAEDLILLESGRIGRDAATAGERVRIEGRVGRDLFVAGDSVEVQGGVGRDLVVRADGLTLLADARVGGDLDVMLPRGHTAEIAPGATVAGERTEGVLDHEHHLEGSRWTHAGFYVRSLVMVVSAFLVGMLLQLVRPGLFEHALPAASDFFRELGLGFVAIVVTPVAIVIAFVTVVGIPLGVLGLFAFVSGLFVSGILVASLLGQAVLGRRDGSMTQFGGALLLGLLIVTLAVNLPFVGPLLRLVVVMTGTGMLIAHVRDSWRLRAL